MNFTKDDNDDMVITYKNKKSGGAITGISFPIINVIHHGLLGLCMTIVFPTVLFSAGQSRHPRSV